MPSLIDFVVGLLLVGGGFFGFAAALGVARGGSPFGRIQAFAKAGPLGASLILMAAAVFAGEFTVFMRALAAAALLLVNSALMAQVLAEWSYRGTAQPPPKALRPTLAPEPADAQTEVSRI